MPRDDYRHNDGGMRRWWHAPDPPSARLSDSDRNILADLRHEACETCANCGIHICTWGEPWEFQWCGDNVCEDCLDMLSEAQAERRDEARREGALNRGGLR